MTANLDKVVQISELTGVQDVEKIIVESEKKPVFIFKHSSICPISDNALQEYKGFVREYGEDSFIYTLVKIREHRDVSNILTEKVRVKHESPQAILLWQGKAVWTDSHFEITKDKFKQVVIMYENGDLRNRF